MTDPALVSAAGGSGPYPPATLLGNRFRVKDHLWTDGGVQLYRASDAQSGGDVALYVIAPSGPKRALLERELAKAQRVPAHNNVAGITGVATDTRHVFVGYEWQEGHTLRQIIDAQSKQGAPIGPERAYTLLGHVAAGIEHAYSELVHGGVNPGNIWITGGGRVKVSDIGLPSALPALARGGGPANAPAGLYLAPEVASGASPTPASDVYALGAILFELLTGRPPAPPLQPPSRLVPTLSPALDAVVGRALLPNPAGRQATPSEFLKAFSATLNAPPAPTAAGEARPTAGRPFDVTAAAGLSQEQARWLVQKDRLDFGPFSLAQVKAQIEQGTFRGDNLIVDMDSGARQKIADHPQLGDFSRDAERRLEHARRTRAENDHQSVEKKKYRAFVLIIGAALLVVGAGLGIFLKNRKAATEGELAERAGDADIDDFLKGIKVDFPSSKRPTVRRASHGGGGGGGKDDPFNGTTNLGDVSGGGEEELLSDRVIQSVMMSNYRKLVPCIMDEKHRSPGLSDMDLEFIVTGAGKVSAVKVNGQRNGAFPGCVLAHMQSFNFPKYNGSKTIASWSMSMR